MVTTNIKQYSDEEIIALIEAAEDVDAPTNIGDLKKLLAEVTNRRLDSGFAGRLNALINQQIAGGNFDEAQTQLTRRTVGEKADNKQKPGFNPKKHPDFVEADEEYEKFPVLCFLASLYKILAWFSLIVCIAGGCIVGFMYLADEPLFIAAAIVGGIMAGTVFVLMFYAMAEKILLSLEIERHLSRREDFFNR